MTALFNLGFRPFFLGAGVFASLSMAAWLAIYAAWYQPAMQRHQRQPVACARDDLRLHRWP
jgi:uncharacterized protein involved in response to NO